MENQKQQNEALIGGSGLNAGLGLLPCPFCGGKAEFGTVPQERKYAGDDECRVNHDWGGEFIQCANTGCAASSMLIFPTMADAKPLLAEKWNKRMPNVELTGSALLRSPG